MSVFRFVDRISEVVKNEGLTAFYTLTGHEEFLLDHFEGFPVMPGVLMLEALTQASSSLLAYSSDFEKPLYRLESVSDVKFGQFVKPGSQLKLTVRLLGEQNGSSRMEGRIERIAADGKSVAGKALSAALVLRPVTCSSEEKPVLEKHARSFFDS
jgi:3-hydroxyacyl-[acyl-carrier-protein] dehydratase